MTRGRRSHSAAATSSALSTLARRARRHNDARASHTCRHGAASSQRRRERRRGDERGAYSRGDRRRVSPVAPPRRRAPRRAARRASAIASLSVPRTLTRASLPPSLPPSLPFPGRPRRPPRRPRRRPPRQPRDARDGAPRRRATRDRARGVGFRRPVVARRGDDAGVRRRGRVHLAHLALARVQPAASRRVFRGDDPGRLRGRAGHHERALQARPFRSDEEFCAPRRSLRVLSHTGSHTTALAWWTPFLKDFPGASLHPPLAGFNPRPRRLSTPLLTPFNSPSIRP